MLSENPSADVRGNAARRLVRAASEAGLTLAPLLLYGDAVHVPLTTDAASAWRDTVRETGLTVVACPAASERRGVVVPQDAPAFPVEPMGLPAWLDAALGAERVVRL